MAEQQPQQVAVFIRQLLVSLIREIENCNGGRDNLDSVAYRTDWLYNCLVRYLGVNDSVSDQLVSLVRDAKDQLDVLVHQDTASYSYRVDQVPHGGRGRPKFVVSREQLQYLLERGFSVPDVAQLLGLSLRTTERRLQEFGISSGQFFTTIDNETLDRTVETILRSFPSYGCRRMTGSLLSRGIKVLQVRIRESMRRVNPEGVLLRALTINTITRRKYRVYAPLALWHVDGNHKLIRLVGLVDDVRDVGRMIQRRRGTLSPLGNSITELQRRKYNENTFLQYLEVLLLQFVARVNHYNKVISSLRCIIFLVCGHQGKGYHFRQKCI